MQSGGGGGACGSAGMHPMIWMYGYDNIGGHTHTHTHDNMSGGACECGGRRYTPISTYPIYITCNILHPYMIYII